MNAFRATASVLVVATALAVVGCSASSGSAPSAAPTAFVAQTTINTVDPLLSDTIQNDVPSDLLYDSVVDYDDAGNLVPRVATEWAISDDLTSVDLTLRDDITFSDGSPLTSADVVYSMKRILAAGVGAASFLSGVADVTAPDATHVTITLKAPDATFLGALSKVFVVNSAVVSSHEGSDNAQSWLAANAAGSGAYTLTSMTQAETIRMALRTDAWQAVDGMPDTYVLQAFSDSSSLSTALRGGAVNLGTLLAKDAQLFTGDSAYDVQSFDGVSGTYVYFNTRAGITADPRVREAISLAYDYQAHVDGILGGEGVVASSILPPTGSCTVDLPARTQNVAKATSLIEQAGVAGQSLTLVYQPNQPDHAAAAVLLQSNLKDIGLDVTLQTTTFPAYNDSLKSIDTTPALAIANDRARYPEPYVMLNRQLNSAFVEKGSNRSQYSNPEVDALLARAQTTPDAAARCEVYSAIEKIVADDDAVMPLAFPDVTFVSSSDVSGVAYSPVRIQFDPMSVRVG
ncbi:MULTISPECIES: ABC transporter substrate-binding protein [unclassified Microbacterium]|uniref:ABC transporter substrate-binding protein n=1 Tax=unclassified Microbacterium TaxID=2609290 RepID=UPI003016C853